MGNSNTKLIYIDSEVVRHLDADYSCQRPASCFPSCIWSSVPGDPPCRVLSIPSNRRLVVIRRVLAIIVLGNYTPSRLLKHHNMASVIVSLSRPTSLLSLSHHSPIHVPSSPVGTNSSASSSKASFNTDDDGEFSPSIIYEFSYNLLLQKMIQSRQIALCWSI